MDRRRLVLVTGMSGSGKTTLCGIMRESGLRILTMGDVIRELARQQGLEPTPENLGQLATKIREEGADAVAVRCIDMLRKMPQGLTVVDGIRSLAEIEAFKNTFEVVLVAVHASPLSRFKRLTKRGRSDDPVTWEEFRERDRRELGFGIGDAIAMADIMIVNDDGVDQLRISFEKLMERVSL
jgi:dephospho-CoA kinase